MRLGPLSRRAGVGRPANMLFVRRAHRCVADRNRGDWLIFKLGVSFGAKSTSAVQREPT